MSQEKNVLGGELMACSYSPLTGYFRDGSCATHGADGVAPQVVLEATHESVLEYVPLAALKQRALDLN
jgi:uncharacterized protein (DUF2237 family)